MKVESLKLKVKGSRGRRGKGQGEEKGLHLSILLLTACYLLLATFWGCGYELLGRDTLPFPTIKIGMIENKTYEPKLEDKLNKALALELTRNGVTVSNDAKYVISGVIENFQLKALAERKGLAVEYEVVIKGQFFLTLPNGKVKELRNSGKFIVSFYNEGTLQSIMSSKEQVTESALNNLSSEIRAGLVYE